MANILNVREDASHEWTAIEAIQGPPGEPGPAGPGAEIVEFTITPESMTEFSIEASHTPTEVEALIEDGKFVMAVMTVTGLGVVRALPSIFSGHLAFFMQVVGGTSSEESSVEIMSGRIFANDDEWTCEIYDNTVVNENQGSENAGKVMTVDDDGTVVPKTASAKAKYLHSFILTNSAQSISVSFYLILETSTAITDFNAIHEAIYTHCLAKYSGTEAEIAASGYVTDNGTTMPVSMLRISKTGSIRNWTVFSGPNLAPHSFTPQYRNNYVYTTV